MLVYILSICVHLFSFFYNIGNNAHWLATMGFMDKYMKGTLKWKQFKDFFCLLKNGVDLTRSVLIYLNLFKTEEDVLTELD